MIINALKLVQTDGEILMADARNVRILAWNAQEELTSAPSVIILKVDIYFSMKHATIHVLLGHVETWPTLCVMHVQNLDVRFVTAMMSTFACCANTTYLSLMELVLRRALQVRSRIWIGSPVEIGDYRIWELYHSLF